MKQSNIFIFSMMASACLFFAGRLVVGSGGTDVRPLAKSLGVATINDCKVMGRIEGRTNGVYVVFDVANPSTDEKEIKFNYLASLTPPTSMMSRMGPRPETVKKGTLTYRAKAGNTTEEVLLKESVPVAEVDAKTNTMAAVTAKRPVDMFRELTPEIWSLVVSREEIKGIHGWGAVQPAASHVAINLDKGEVVLASTIQEKAAK